MKTILKLFRIFIFKKSFLFFITSIIIILLSILTIFQAEAGQAFFSILNRLSVNRSSLENSNNKNNNSSLLNFLSRLLSSGSVNNAIEIIIETRNLNYIIISGVLIIFIFLLYQIFFYLQNVFAGILGLEVSLDYMKATFDKLINLPSLYYKSEGKTGDIISRLTNDIQNVRTYSIYIIISVFSIPILFIFSLYMLIRKSLKFTLILIVFGLFAFIIINLVSKLIKKMVKINMEKSADTVEYINKTIFGIDIIKIFNKGEKEKSIFSNLLKDYRKSFIQRFFLEFSIRPLTEMVGAVILVFVLLTGAYLIWNNKMSIDTILGFIIYLIILSPKANEISTLFSNIKIIEASIERIEEILNYEEESLHFGKKQLNNFSGEVEFKNVYFSYSNFEIDKNKNEDKDKEKDIDINVDIDTDKKISKDNTKSESHQLVDVSFKINKNEYVAIVGPSGSGKSTIVNLIATLLYPTKGTILFDGNNYQDYNIESLRKYISYVTQETILFPDTIYNNIAFGAEKTNLDEVIYYSKIAHAHDFIVKLPDGYNTMLGERGARISGGEKQRIAIARALIKKPRVLIFDEATSNLDSESENFISMAMTEISKMQTTIIIAHRLSTVLKADKIILIKNGHIQDIGKHEELLKRNELYKRLYENQFEKI